MKTSKVSIIIAIVLLILSAFAFKWLVKNPDTVNDSMPEGQTAGISGCYVSRTGKDVYTLNIQKEQSNFVSGTLSFKNFQKDSSSGTFTGVYDNGILLGEYAFRSEGMDSLIQVIFKKSGDSFIRGYGELNENGTSFINTDNINYDPSSSLNVFKKESCV